MSIVPISGQEGNPFSLDLWDPFNNFDVWNWNPFFTDGFPGFWESEIFPFSFGTQQQLNWKETPRSHVFKAYLPGVSRDDVIVFIDDDKILQISTQDGNFMSRFKLPDNAKTDQIQGFMDNGVLIVTIGKDAQAPPQRPNVRVVEITE